VPPELPLHLVLTFFALWMPDNFPRKSCIQILRLINKYCKHTKLIKINVKLQNTLDIKILYIYKMIDSLHFIHCIPVVHFTTHLKLHGSSRDVSTPEQFLVIAVHILVCFNLCRQHLTPHLTIVHSPSVTPRRKNKRINIIA